MLPFLSYFGEFALVVLVALAAVLLKTIDGRGFLASVGVGLAIIFGGGLSWFVLVAVFFITGVAFTLYRYGYKRHLGGAQEKGGARNWPNILANGGLPSLFAIGQLVAPSPWFVALFLGSISAAAADTAATELGLLSRSKPRLITNPSREVSPGTSGGVTSLGFGGALLAAGIMGSMAFLLGIAEMQGRGLFGFATVMAGCLGAGLGGALVDSLIGAVVQRKGYCPACLKPTEATRHCGEKTRVVGGTFFIENNTVNVVATFVGGLACLSVFVLGSS
ncbi:MAG: DUF92 domain-containing protein [Thaumarchaeota archaeon]|nr:DUF92 domain-containing protein [Nitrososphaerota archaeon]